MGPWETTWVQTLFVASGGGHLQSLWGLRPRLSGPEGDVTWVTFDTPQSRSLLADEQRIFIPFARPRDVRATVSHTRLALHILGLAHWDRVVSTGCLPAVPFLTLARARGIECHYIESPTRVLGPSMSATLLEKVPGVHRYSQYRWPDRPNWQYRGSIFDNYEAVPREPPEVERVVVTVGTNAYGFRRLVAKAVDTLPQDADVFWQTGTTDTARLGIAGRPFVPEEELTEAMRKAEVVICHAGVGSVLDAFDAGRCPVIVPRRSSCGEHVDDHQVQLAEELTRRGLAVSVEADALNPEVLAAAASRRVVTTEHPPPFPLEGPGTPQGRPDAAFGKVEAPSRHEAA